MDPPCKLISLNHLVAPTSPITHPSPITLTSQITHPPPSAPISQSHELMIRPYVIPSELCQDWHKCVRKGTHNGFDVLIIPTNTLLFRGVPADVKVQARRHQMRRRLHPNAMSNPIYLADLPVAAYYAFASDDICGEQGKIITYRTTQSINLLDMASLANYHRLAQMNVPPCGVPGHPDVLSYAFGYTPGTTQLKRISHRDIDLDLAQWLCSLNLGSISGYAYSKLPGFHSEILLCHPKNQLKLYPLEYRFVSYYNPDVVIETFQGHLTGRELTFPEIASSEMRVRPRYSTQDIYRPSHDSADAFLCQEPFISLRRQALMRNETLYRPYTPGDELCYQESCRLN
jgi:hypothetical protein